MLLVFFLYRRIKVEKKLRYSTAATALRLKNTFRSKYILFNFAVRKYYEPTAAIASAVIARYGEPRARAA